MNLLLSTYSFLKQEYSLFAFTHLIIHSFSLTLGFNFAHSVTLWPRCSRRLKSESFRPSNQAAFGELLAVLRRLIATYIVMSPPSKPQETTVIVPH